MGPRLLVDTLIRSYHSLVYEEAQNTSQELLKLSSARENLTHRQHFQHTPRRELRLLGFFDPYPAVKPKLVSNIEHPIVIRQKIENQKRSFEVLVWNGLLVDDVPVWIESAIFRYARRYIRCFLKEPGKAEKEARLENGAETIFALFRERQQQIATQQSLFDYSPPKPTHTKTQSSDSQLCAIWVRLRVQYFPEQPLLDNYAINWADRNQRSCLASCNVERQRVEVAKALDHPSCYGILEPLIYHEMCHAALGPPKVVRGRRIMHGKDFKQLEKRHPLIPTLDNWIEQGGWRRAVLRHRRAKRSSIN